MGLSQWRRGGITGQQHLGEERETGDRMRRENMQHADAEFAVLILLAPDTRRSVHQRRERSVGAAQSPHAGEFFGSTEAL